MKFRVTHFVLSALVVVLSVSTSAHAKSRVKKEKGYLLVVTAEKYEKPVLSQITEATELSLAYLTSENVADYCYVGDANSMVNIGYKMACNYLEFDDKDCTEKSEIYATGNGDTWTIKVPTAGKKEELWVPVSPCPLTEEVQELQ